MPTRLFCDDSGWVCENHPDAACNRSRPEEPPRLPRGFKTDGE